MYRKAAKQVKKDFLMALPQVQATARDLRMVVDEFRKIDPKIPIQTVQAFLLCVERPGITKRELEKETGLAQSSIWRNMDRLATSEGGRDLKLIELIEDPRETRRTIPQLTHAGRGFMERLTDILSGRSQKRAARQSEESDDMVYVAQGSLSYEKKVRFYTDQLMRAAGLEQQESGAYHFSEAAELSRVREALRQAEAQLAERLKEVSRQRAGSDK